MLLTKVMKGLGRHFCSTSMTTLKLVNILSFVVHKRNSLRGHIRRGLARKTVTRPTPLGTLYTERLMLQARHLYEKKRFLLSARKTNLSFLIKVRGINYN